MHAGKKRNRPRTLIWTAAALASLQLAFASPGVGSALAAENAEPAGKKAKPQPVEQRRELFERIGVVTGIPWYYLAAIDQYERTLTKARPKSRPQPTGLLAISVPPDLWAGTMNPDEEETSPGTIRHFGGIGLDGDGDGKADRRNDADVLYTVANHILRYGTAEDDFAIGLWEYYHNTRAVQRVIQFSDVYAAFDRMDLSGHAFPLPVRSDYSYRSTWGSGRSWGGRRIHEGTDIFADYGVPVRSTCFGTVEVKGWNPYGGWRIGIRDLDNIYHYYAHLSGYNKDINVGDIVSPGQVIGWVGSSGYGKPGTQGKFPPHLHYGVYRDRGLVEWSFDPYPMLKAWEREERQRLKKQKQ